MFRFCLDALVRAPACACACACACALACACAGDGIKTFSILLFLLKLNFDEYQNLTCFFFHFAAIDCCALLEHATQLKDLEIIGCTLAPKVQNATPRHALAHTPEKTNHHLRVIEGTYLITETLQLSGVLLDIIRLIAGIWHTRAWCNHQYLTPTIMQTPTQMHTRKHLPHSHICTEYTFHTKTYVWKRRSTLAFVFIHALCSLNKTPFNWSTAALPLVCLYIDKDIYTPFQWWFCYWVIIFIMHQGLSSVLKCVTENRAQLTKLNISNNKISDIFELDFTKSTVWCCIAFISVTVLCVFVCVRCMRMCMITKGEHFQHQN